MNISKQKRSALKSYIDLIKGNAYPPLAPLELFIEISNICNMQCAMCPTFSSLNFNRAISIKEKQRGFFDLETCRDRLETILPHVLYVHTYGYGEPTIHPHFKELIDYLSQYRVMIDFITNGLRLDRDLCDFLVQKKVAKVTISFSGSNKNDYENIYVGGQFESVLNAMRYLDEAKKKHHALYPLLTVNSIGFRHHINELPRFVDLMADHGVDLIEVKKLVESIHYLRGHAAPFRPEIEGRILKAAKRRAAERGILLSAEQYENESNGFESSPPSIQIDEIPRLAKDISFDHKKKVQKTKDMDLLSLDIDREFEIELNLTPLNKENFGTEDLFYCMEPYKTMYIRQNGFVKPCCFAPDTPSGLGNIHTRSGKDIWRGKAFSTIRKGIALEKYPKPLCEACIRQGIGYKDNSIQDLLKNYEKWYQVCFDETLNQDSFLDAVYSFIPLLRARLGHVSPEELIRTLKKKHPDQFTSDTVAPLKMNELIQIIRRRSSLGISLGSMISGYLDRINEHEILGWLYCSHIPEFHGTIVIRHPETDQEIARGNAVLFRKDLKAAGIGNGEYGFSIALPSGCAKENGISPERFKIMIEAFGISMNDVR